LRIPVILSEAQPALIISKNRDEIVGQLRKLRQRIEAVLRNPAQHDLVYQTMQRLFRNKSRLNLTRDDNIRFTIRRFARRRFILGYPPRKHNDTSLGDPINWEWIVYCAKQTRKDVIIVSRDSDYGYRYGNEPIINDWLLQEFKERVSRKKKVVLTNRLTHAFELASITVKRREKEDENRLIGEISKMGLLQRELFESIRSIYSQSETQAAQEQLLKWLASYWQKGSIGLGEDKT